MLNLQTLYDLDILSRDATKASLYDKLNHCKTQGGRNALKNLFFLADTNADSVNKRQDAISYMSEKRFSRFFTITENDIFYTKSYLDSTYTIAGTNKSKNLVAAAKTFIGNKERLYFITSGVKNTLIIIQTIEKIITALRVDAPKLLMEFTGIADEVLTTLNIPADASETYRNGQPSIMTCFAMDKLLREEKKDVLKLLDIYYLLEAYNSLAIGRKSMGLKTVSFNAGNNIQIKQLIHPMVKNCVPNDAQIDEAKNILLITGPNMAGKSTFMKSMGLAFFMAYLGVGVAAMEATLPIMGNIVSSINTEDNVSSGYSYFFAEVQHIKEIAETVVTGKSTLVIIDELFKGTNVKDAMDCTDIVWKGFVKQRNCIFIFSTHLIEVAKLYEHNLQFSFAYFDAKIEQDELLFDYTVKKGISALRLGTHILRQSGVPGILDVE